MKAIYILLATTTLAFISCGGGENKKATNEKTSLVFAPQKGDSQQYSYTFKVTNETSKDETEFIIDLTTKVEEVTADRITLITKYDAIRMNAVLGGIKTSLIAGDTTGQHGDPAIVAAPVFAFLGQQVIFDFDKQFRKQNEVMPNADTIANLAKTESKFQFIGTYPDSAIAIGTEWEGALGIKVGGKAVDHAKMKLKEVKDGIAYVELKSEINTEGEKFGQTYTMKGELAGSMEVELKSGWQNNCELDIKFTLDMGGNQTQMHQTISCKRKTE